MTFGSHALADLPQRAAGHRLRAHRLGHVETAGRIKRQELLVLAVGVGEKEFPGGMQPAAHALQPGRDLFLEEGGPGDVLVVIAAPEHHLGLAGQDRVSTRSKNGSIRRASAVRASRSSE